MFCFIFIVRHYLHRLNVIQLCNDLYLWQTNCLLHFVLSKVQTPQWQHQRSGLNLTHWSYETAAPAVAQTHTIQFPFIEPYVKDFGIRILRHLKHITVVQSPVPASIFSCFYQRNYHVYHLMAYTTVYQNVTKDSSFVQLHYFDMLYETLLKLI